VTVRGGLDGQSPGPVWWSRDASRCHCA
jgi:hypothetical protein